MEPQRGEPALAHNLRLRGFQVVQPLKSASGSATIFRVQDNEASEPFVAKVVSISGLDAKGRASAQQEVSLLRGLCAHPNLIAYRDSFTEEPGMLYIVMSLADGGDLRMCVAEAAAAQRLLPEPVVLTWLYQTVSGLRHLHGQGVVHRDLKSSNIFLCDGRRRIRIGDFGISRVLESTAFASSCVGTPAYMSPELMRNERYDYHVDMWALGCISFELCTLQLPFSAKSLLDLACQVMEAAPSWALWHARGFSEELREVTQRLLMKDPSARPTADRLLEEPIFSEGGRGGLEPPEEAWAQVGSGSVYDLDAQATMSSGLGGSSEAESSPCLSRSEFADFLTTHQGELLAHLQGSLLGAAGAPPPPPPPPPAAPSSVAPAAESVV